MARPKYRITASDHWFARRWVEKKLINPTWLGETKTFAAHQDFLKRQEFAEELNEWCELWLSSREWAQLKNAVRTSRKRARGSDNISVTLSRYSWSILDFWARREGCTLSEVIEKRLGVGNAMDSG